MIDLFERFHTSEERVGRIFLSMDAWSVRGCLVTVASFILFIVLVFVSGQGVIGQSSAIVAVTLAEHEDGISLFFMPHRKLLHRAKAKASVEPSRIGEDSCGSGDISVSQDSTGTLPNGIPAFRVEISNTCASGCSISKIHISCGWFSSAVLINPKVFKRLSYDNCLVNNGKSLPSGGTVSFKYANTFRYPLSVTSVICT